MKPNLKIFLELCQEKNIPCSIIHPSGNLVEVKSLSGEPYLFTIGTTPFNSHSMVTLCKDKEFFYDYYKGTVRMPRTRSFLTPFCSDEWRSHLEFPTIDAIVQETKKDFDFPCIVKMNKGSQGKCVFKAKNEDELKKSLDEIYKTDYIALVQDYINIQSEYRVIFLHQDLVFAYKKNNENAQFIGNLSPLHFKGAYAEIVEDEKLLQNFRNFTHSMFQRKDIPYCGLDITLDTDNKMWLIEANTSPGFEYFLQNPQGKSLLRGLYTKMFIALGVLPEKEKIVAKQSENAENQNGNYLDY